MYSTLSTVFFSLGKVTTFRLICFNSLKESLEIASSKSLREMDHRKAWDRRERERDRDRKERDTERDRERERERQREKDIVKPQIYCGLFGTVYVMAA